MALRSRLAAVAAGLALIGLAACEVNTAPPVVATTPAPPTVVTTPAPPATVVVPNQ
ncbi:MAG: hypothetical protein JO047_00950 [Alphaproteobacteria bacterium]|nr:hypothetical protein [Alphaproteobacteria bacterium]